MSRFAKFTLIITFFTLFVLFNPKKVHAYIDPGTGSYIFQIILATTLGGLVAIKLYWKKIIMFIKNPFNKKQKPKNENTKAS